MAKQCRQEGYIVPVLARPQQGPGAPDDEGYEGAIVLEPKEGIYTKEPVSVLDYASLYPSSMISENLSHDSLVLDPKYDNLPGIEYVTTEFDVSVGDGEKRTVQCRFAQAGPKGPGEKAILPQILVSLLRARKLTRKRMEHVRLLPDGPEGLYDEGARRLTPVGPDGKAGAPIEGVGPEQVAPAYDEFQLAVLDGLQLAYKVTANSLYGSMGARTSQLYCKQVAASTTAVGRSMIIKAKAFLEAPPWNCKIVYGDSVAGHTPVFVRCAAGVLRVIAVEDLPTVLAAPGASWAPMACAEHAEEHAEEHSEEHEGAEGGGKESLELAPGSEAWTDAGWTPLHRVIRHRLPPGKRMVRVRTGAGLVETTDDHSLLLADGARPVTPKELRLGDRLLHAPLPTPGDRGTWAWAHPPTAEQAGTAGRRIWDASEVPPVLLNAPLEARRAFWEGVLQTARERKAKVIPCATRTLAAAMWLMGESVGAHVRIADEWASAQAGGVCGLEVVPPEDGQQTGEEITGNVFADERGVVSLDLLSVEEAATLSRHRRQARELRRERQGPAPYVYDLTTANGHFAAGVGRMVVHNTDSVFAVFPEAAALQGRDAVAMSIERAHAASAAFKPLLKAPHDLEYDKTFFPFILLSKKRYIGLLFEDNPDKGKLKSMGVALKRRDYAPIVKRIYGGAVDIVLKQLDVPAAAQFVKRSLLDLVEGRVPLDELIISKTLRSHYKFPQMIPHFVLAQRMAERDPGNRPQSNDRIPYVYVDPPKKVLARVRGDVSRLLQGDRVEHPAYVQEHGLTPDYRFYIEHQIMKPTLQMFALALEQLPGFVPKPEVTGQRGLEQLVLDKGGDVKKAKDRWNTLREREAEKLLFAPALNHANFRLQDNARRGQHEITSFFKKPRVENPGS